MLLVFFLLLCHIDALKPCSWLRARSSVERTQLRLQIQMQMRGRGKEYTEIRDEYFKKMNISDEGATELPTSPFSTITQADLDLDFLNGGSSDNDIDDRSRGTAYTSSKAYNPEVGMESIFVTLGNNRCLLPSEYEVAFKNFPELAKATASKIWPEDREIGKDEQDWIDSSLHPDVVTDKEVNLALGRFRKTILGLEKYRINNPGAVAEKYCNIIKTCLRLKGAWGAAANALEYAGLVIKDHVEEEGAEVKNTKVPVLDLTSLWRHCLLRLLDMEYQTESAENLVGHQTNDQKFFSQAPLTETSTLYIQDMMLSILRVSLRALFSRENVNNLVIKYWINPADPLHTLMPRDMSIQIVVEDEFSIDMIEDVDSFDKVGAVTMSYQVSNPTPMSEL